MTSTLQKSTATTYSMYDSIVGPLLLIGTDKGLSQVVLKADGFEKSLGLLAETTGIRPVEDDDSLQDVRQQLDEYFAGTRKVFNVALALDEPASFVERGQRALAEIPYGQTWTYKELATHLGSPGAARAAGSVCSKNPVPIILPCHRVLPADGKIGAYRGGPVMKQTLLRLEGLEVDIAA